VKTAVNASMVVVDTVKLDWEEIDINWGCKRAKKQEGGTQEGARGVAQWGQGRKQSILMLWSI